MPHEQETCPNCKGTGKVEVLILRMLRKRKGFTQGHVAKKLGLTQSAYCRLEDKPLFYSRHANTLADVFGVSIDQLYGRVPIDPLMMRAPRPAKAPPPKRIAASQRRRAAVRKKQQRKKS